MTKKTQRNGREKKERLEYYKNIGEGEGNGIEEDCLSLSSLLFLSF